MVERKLVSKIQTSTTLASSCDEDPYYVPDLIVGKPKPAIKMSQEHEHFIESLAQMRRDGKLKVGKKRICQAPDTIQKETTAKKRDALKRQNTVIEHQYAGEMTHDGQAYGHGTIQYSQGGSYTGTFKDDREHGFGTYSWADGSKCIGEFSSGEWDGYQTAHYASGAIVNRRMIGGHYQEVVQCGGLKDAWFK